MSTVLVTGAKLVPAEALELIESRGHSVRHVTEEELDSGELDQALRDVSGYLIGGVESPTAEHFDKHAETLKAVAFVGTDFKAFVPGWERAFELGIPIINCPGANAISVAEFTIQLMLMMARPMVNQILAEGGRTLLGDDAPPVPFEGMELAGRTLGIVGLGRIGTRVAAVATALGMKVVYNARREDPASHLEFRELDELFATADVICLHRPSAGPGRPAPIGGDLLKLMRPGSLLINAGHEDLVDPEALASAVEHGVRAAFDCVGKGEEWDQLLRFPPERFLAVKQMGYSTFDANRRTGMMAARAVCDVLEGKSSPLVNNP
ncbi:hypothetical protein GCM10027589_06900 [Actinocorallia lasiicapitis]